MSFLCEKNKKLFGFLSASAQRRKRNWIVVKEYIVFFSIFAAIIFCTGIVMYYLLIKLWDALNALGCYELSCS